MAQTINLNDIVNSVVEYEVNEGNLSGVIPDINDVTSNKKFLSDLSSMVDYIQRKLFNLEDIISVSFDVFEADKSYVISSITSSLLNDGIISSENELSSVESIETEQELFDILSSVEYSLSNIMPDLNISESDLLSAESDLLSSIRSVRDSNPLPPLENRFNALQQKAKSDATTAYNNWKTTADTGLKNIKTKLEQIDYTTVESYSSEPGCDYDNLYNELSADIKTLYEHYVNVLDFQPTITYQDFLDVNIWCTYDSEKMRVVSIMNYYAQMYYLSLVTGNDSWVNGSFWKQGLDKFIVTLLKILYKIEMLRYEVGRKHYDSYTEKERKALEQLNKLLQAINTNTCSESLKFQEFETVQNGIKKLCETGIFNEINDCKYKNDLELLTINSLREDLDNVKLPIYIDYDTATVIKRGSSLYKELKSHGFFEDWDTIPLVVGYAGSLAFIVGYTTAEIQRLFINHHHRWTYTKAGRKQIHKRVFRWRDTFKVASTSGIAIGAVLGGLLCVRKIAQAITSIWCYFDSDNIEYDIEDATPRGQIGKANKLFYKIYKEQVERINEFVIQWNENILNDVIPLLGDLEQNHYLIDNVPMWCELETYKNIVNNIDGPLDCTLWNVEKQRFDCSGNGWIEMRTCDKCGKTYRYCTEHGIEEEHDCNPGDDDGNSGDGDDVVIVDVEACSFDDSYEGRDWCENENCANHEAHMETGSWVSVLWDPTHGE